MKLTIYLFKKLRHVCRLAPGMMTVVLTAMLLLAPHAVVGAHGDGVAGGVPDREDLLQQKKKVAGSVVDEDGDPMPGATVTVKGTTRGVITAEDGTFDIEVDPGDVLVISFIGKETVEVPVGNRVLFNVTLEEGRAELEDVTVVAFAQQKKESVIGSITTVKPAELKLPSSNLTTSLAGRMSGIISYQRSGEPGEDNAQFFVRGVTTFGYKKDPLILIDGVELTSEDLAKMQPDDIASFSIMKDATATALYGARGANGVIYVTTKEGREGRARVSVRYETSVSRPTQTIELADPITYMEMHNEAVKTRDPLGLLPYSLEKIEKTKQGVDPVLYPTTDWYNAMFKPYAVNKRLNFSVSGGGKVARYYLAATMNNDNGILKVDKRNNFTNNIDLKKYNLRANINLNLTKTTQAKFIFNTTFDDYTGPIDGGSAMYNKVMRSNPVYFRPYYEPDEANQYKNHILFGNYGNGDYYNPYADMVKGYKDYSQNRVLAQFELHQDLNWITEGLKVRAMGMANRYSFFDVIRSYNPFYYRPVEDPLRQEPYILLPLNVDEGTEYLGYTPGSKDIISSWYFESAMQYNREFDKHGVSGLLVYIMREELFANADNLQLSLPYRNMGLSGRFTYSYDSRYFTELNFGYNGSERFSESERFGFFPSVGLAWIASNEGFFAGIKDVVSLLKLKGTYGLVGNDAIGSPSDRFFYMSQVNMNDGGRSIPFGTFMDYSRTGVSISRYANDQITWETARKLNIGIELGLFEKLMIQADVFHDTRYNILMDRIHLASMGLESPVRANVGEAVSEGVDLSLDFNTFITNDFWIQARGNFTYATSEITRAEEPDYSETPWLSRVGHPINQVWGYVAERLFVDQTEVDNSPEQTFGEYTGGDIKYRDINGDDRISGIDQVPLGFPTTPEIVYGAGLSLGYKSFDLSFFFQGLARESFWVSPYWTAPFLDVDGNGNITSNNQLIEAYADSYWSEENRDVYALWPRLSTYVINNNNRTSTKFMADGSFLRLKSLEIGYSLPRRIVEKVKMTQARFYVNGTNLWTLSNFNLWDPEMGGNGLGYPIQMVVNGGIQLSF
ncbi:MAG: TonB-dependent receptor [Bacteroidales bacterium]|nr:TonB-dependent receptor [Bacteroidales bacterium]MDT8430427.1 TonB-dependent receptor [Bacteroidales bacterium]